MVCFYPLYLMILFIASPGHLINDLQDKINKHGK